ncbi:hypothetical protein GOV06_00800 [Candidatus Woesearchaeota archaeon]|nr:hypothetical protein [Candidatus Woesearchaeota archaeon]
MKKQFIILIGLLFLSLLTVSADDFEFKIESIRSEIDSGETAQFLLVITSNLSTIKEFRIYLQDIEWDMPSEVIKIYPQTDTSHKLVITPSKYIEPGKTYGVRINLKDTTTEEVVYSGIAAVSVKSSEKAVSAYRPSVRMTVDLPLSIDPSKEVSVKVKLENQNLLNLTDLVLGISSDVTGFEVEQDVQLIPLGKKIVELKYDLDPLQKPGKYILKFNLMRTGEVIESEVKTVTIDAISDSFKEEETKMGFFFKTTTIKKITSTSNIDGVKTIKIQTTLLKSWFTSTNPKATKLKEDGARYLIVEVDLEPGEVKDVSVVINFRILIYILLLAALCLGINYRYKSPLTIRKGVSDVNTKEGGISDLKITLEISNKDKKKIKHVTITDYIPDIAYIAKEFGEGTLKPSRVFRHRTKGMILKWDIEELAPGEDRLISYTVKSKLSIVGNFKIPRAKATFKRKGRDISAYSNASGVSS